MTSVRPSSTGFALIALIAVQAFCAIFFLSDVLGDVAAAGHLALLDWHIMLEVAANLGLLAGVAFEWNYLMRLLRRQERTDRALGVASGALNDLIEGYFAEWGLTPAEQDVAAFTLKGFSISEIAGLRGSAEGTVKTQLNAIYRKSGAAGRGQLVSLLIEDLMRAPLVADVMRQRPADAAPSGPVG